MTNRKRTKRRFNGNGVVSTVDTPMPEGPNHWEVADRAYGIWLMQGRPKGRAIDRWLMAELLCEQDCQRMVNEEGNDWD